METLVVSRRPLPCPRGRHARVSGTVPTVPRANTFPRRPDWPPYLDWHRSVLYRSSSKKQRRRQKRQWTFDQKAQSLSRNAAGPAYAPSRAHNKFVDYAVARLSPPNLLAVQTLIESPSQVKLFINRGDGNVTSNRRNNFNFALWGIQGGDMRLHTSRLRGAQELILACLRPPPQPAIPQDGGGGDCGQAGVRGNIRRRMTAPGPVKHGQGDEAVGADSAAPRVTHARRYWSGISIRITDDRQSECRKGLR